MRALLDPAVTVGVYAPGATHYISKLRRVPLRPFGSDVELVIEAEPPVELQHSLAKSWVPEFMRPTKPPVDHNLSQANEQLIIDRLKNGCVVSLVRINTAVVLNKWTPANMPPLGHVVAALVEHRDAEAIAMDMRTMKSAPIEGFVVAAKR
jgi:hypothetical protein